MPIGNPIDTHPVLGPYSEKLKALGYATVEEVFGAASGAAEALGRYLERDLAGVLPQAPRPFAAPDFQLGVVLDGIPPPQIAFAMAAPFAGPLPSAVNLIPQMQTIRDQAHRGTCVAYAALAALENLRQNGQDLSEQFLYWDCKQNDNIPATSGTWLGVAVPLLQRDGCCLENTWPYNPNPVPGNEGQNPPPPGAAGQAATMRIASFQQFSPTSVLDFKRELARGRCMPFSIPVYNSWFQNPAVRTSGDIHLPFPGEAVLNGHAMCICGYEDNPAEEPIGGGRFILRNSWGSAWGTASRFGVGYGTIPYAYIARFGREAYSIE